MPEGWKIRLPSEAEWEKAARGGLEIPAKPLTRTVPGPFSADDTSAGSLTSNPDPQRSFPWGGVFKADRCNGLDSNILNTSAMGCFPNGASPCGCEEMSGNVLEWTRSQYKGYPHDPADGRESESDAAAARVLRGGYFAGGAVFLRCTARIDDAPAHRYYGIGFRVVLSPSEL